MNPGPSQPQQPAAQPIFAIHIIESPNEEDIFLGTREEGEALQKCLGIMGVKSERYRVSSEAFLVKAIATITTAHSQGGTYERYAPIVHLSCHGNDEGIGLTNGDFLTWERLKEFLRPIHVVARGWLILGMSACKGAAARKMAWTIKSEDTSFDLLFGPTHEVLWQDSLVGFVTLYHRLAKAIPPTREALDQLTDTVNDATGLPRGTFTYGLAADERNGFRDFVMRWAARRREEAAAQQASAASAALVAALRASAKPPAPKP